MAFKISTNLNVANLFAEDRPLITITWGQPIILTSEEYVIYKHAIDALATYLSVEESPSDETPVMYAPDIATKKVELPSVINIDAASGAVTFEASSTQDASSGAITFDQEFVPINGPVDSPLKKNKKK